MNDGLFRLGAIASRPFAERAAWTIRRMQRGQMPECVAAGHAHCPSCGQMLRLVMLEYADDAGPYGVPFNAREALNLIANIRFHLAPLDGDSRVALESIIDGIRECAHFHLVASAGEPKHDDDHFHVQ